MQQFEQAPVPQDLQEQVSSLNSDLGSPSSASAVTGADAFSKIATLNSNTLQLSKPNVLSGAASSDSSNAFGISLRRADNQTIYFLRARETGRVGFDKSTDNGTSWSNLYECAKSSEVEQKILTPMLLSRNGNSQTTYAFTCPRYSSGEYTYFLLIGGTGATAGFLYHGFVNTEGNNNAVYLNPVYAGNTFGLTLTGSYNGNTNTLTITSSATCWGGMRIIWLS